MKCFKVLLVAVLGFAACGGLFGQSYRTFMNELTLTREETRFHFGPFLIKPLFRLSNFGYDSNVYYRDRTQAPVSDYTGTISPEAKVSWILGNSLILYFRENPEYVFFLKEKNLRRFTNSYATGFRLLFLGRFVISGDYHDLRHSRRIYSEFDRQIKDIQQGYSLGLFFETPRGTSLGFTGSVDDFRYEDIVPLDPVNDYAAALNRSEKSGFFEFYYPIFSASIFFYTLGYTEYAFDFEETAWRDAHSFQTYGGIRFPLIGRARGTLSIGYKKFVPKEIDREPFSGLVASTDLDFRFGRFGFKLGYRRDNYFSYLDSAYFYVEDNAGISLSFYLTEFMKIEGGYQSSGLRYPEPHLIWYRGEFIEVQSRKDNNRIGSIGLTFRLTGVMGIGVNYNLYRRTSNAPGFEINRDFFGAFITYDF